MLKCVFDLNILRFASPTIRKIAVSYPAMTEKHLTDIRFDSFGLADSIMQGIDRASGRNSGGQRYSEHVATYLAMRNERRQTHEQAIRILSEFLNSLGNR